MSGKRSAVTEVRKDSKGRKLYEGEFQEENGRYRYMYYDKYNKRKVAYSWRLTDADAVPEGKRECKPLRELEKEIEKGLHDEIDVSISKKATLNERFDLYMKNKINIKTSTRSNYIYMYDNYVREKIGNMKIVDINYSVMQDFYNSFIRDLGFMPNSIDNIHTIVNPLFDRAVLDNIIRTNPCTKAMEEIRNHPKWVSKGKKKKVSVKGALSKNQQIALIDFINDNDTYHRWVNIVTCLLGTGMRISECIGLTWDDVFFDKNYININHSLLYRQWEDGVCEHRVMLEPKTESGGRNIPMFPEVREALLREKAYQDEVGTAGTVISGFSNWVFTNRYKTVMSAASVNKALARIVRDYNKEEMARAESEGRTPRLMPHISNHKLRHTFCTRLVEMGMNIKVIQDIMGHADFDTTMDIYTDVNDEFKEETVAEYAGRLYLG